MARNHKWWYIVNQAGEPINAAHVFVYKAGTTDPVWVYFDEFGSTGSRSTSGQISTLENGYFEFWIDEDEDFDVCNTSAVDDSSATSYPFNQKFKIRWEKTGIASGQIDYIDVFPANRYFRPANISGCSDSGVSENAEMNKVVSNYLVCRWEEHVNQDFRDLTNPTLVHGFDYLNTSVPNNIFNKIVTNNQGWLWDIHELTNVYEYSLSGSSLGGESYTKSPHDIWPVDPDNTIDTKVNKIVSNQMIKDMYDQIAESKSEIYTVSTALTADYQWSLVSGYYETTINHNLAINFPDVICYGYIDSKWMLIKTAEVEWVDADNIKISIAHEPVGMRVRIST